MKPILIAELCQNHLGDRNLLGEMIAAAAESGADYVKIQAARSQELVFRERFEEGLMDETGTRQVAIKRPYQAEFDRLSKLDLDIETEAWFVNECQRNGVAPMTTAFTRQAARDVSEMGYEGVKIASYDCASYPLLYDVKQLWSRIAVSTGATYDHEVARAAEALEGREFTFLHCVTIYPTPLNECHLARMQWLRRFTPRVGWSDHTLVKRDGLKASLIALGLGADMIERHFTILAEDKTKDGPVSITPKMLLELRQFSDLGRRDRMKFIEKEIPEWREALGQANRDLSGVELLNRDYYRGRFASRVEGKVIYNWEDVDW